jgi:hypothetical protein
MPWASRSESLVRWLAFFLNHALHFVKLACNFILFQQAVEWNYLEENAA